MLWGFGISDSTGTKSLSDREGWITRVTGGVSKKVLRSSRWVSIARYRNLSLSFPLAGPNHLMGGKNSIRMVVMGSTGKARGGGGIRNHEGVWLKRYARPIGSTDNCRAELWALRDGLVMAKEMGLNSLVIELDALSVVLLMTNNNANLLMEPLLTDCKNMLREIPNKQIVHAYCEANQCTNALAKLGAISLSSFTMFLCPLPVVDNILAFDKANMCYNRLVNSQV